MTGKQSAAGEALLTTAPQSPVALIPVLPTRRNAELALLCFASLITGVALMIVEANQERGLSWDLLRYTGAFLAVFSIAHLMVRRFAPYADPLLLPVVALLNGLGLVLIHRLDLAGDTPAGKPGAGHGSTNRRRSWSGTWATWRTRIWPGCGCSRQTGRGWES